jgi:hypothetical protein
MAAGFLECVLAGLVPLLLAGALLAQRAQARPLPVRATTRLTPAGATRPRR